MTQIYYVQIPQKQGHWEVGIFGILVVNGLNLAVKGKKGCGKDLGVLRQSIWIPNSATNSIGKVRSTACGHTEYDSAIMI